jgi:hypothetical protein
VIVSKNKFIVASKESPMEFWVEDYGSDEDIMKAFLYDTENEAENDIKESDDPNFWKVMPVEIIYRF